MKKLAAIIIATALLCMALLPLTANTKTKEADIFDALEILKSLVGMENKAAQLTGITDRELTIYDVLDILKGIVGMGEPVIVNVVEEGTEPPVTTTAPATTTPPGTTTPTAPVTTTTPPKTDFPAIPGEGEIDFAVLEHECLQGNVSRYELMSQSQIHVASSFEEMKFLIEIVEMCNYENCNCKYHNIENITPKNIDESFFNTQKVIVFYSAIGAGNRHITIDKIIREEERVVVYTTTEISLFPSPDMAYFRVFLTIDSEDFKNANEVINRDTSVSIN